MAKISIDDALSSFANFQGYEGDKPTNENEYKNLKPFKLNYETVFSGTAPTWAEILAKQTELQSAEDTKCNDKVSAYRKLSMSDDEILAIDNSLKEYL